MVTGKEKFALWLTPEAREMVRRAYRSDNCASQSEFIEKAIRFYCGYLGAKKDGAYLPRVLAEILEGILSTFGSRVGRLLFKQIVEQSILAHIVAADTDIDLDTLEKLRGRCVQDARRTNGEISFQDILRFQKGL